jgi:hypothetical protein
VFAVITSLDCESGNAGEVDCWWAALGLRDEDLRARIAIESKIRGIL